MAAPVLDGLQCMNCKQPTGPGEAKLFAEVFVCPTCHEMAVRLFNRLETDLRRLLWMSKEVIRAALTEGKLKFEASNEQEVSKEELLQLVWPHGPGIWEGIGCAAVCWVGVRVPGECHVALPGR